MNKKSILKKTLLYSLMAAMAISLAPIQADAYGETTQSSTLVNDTKKISDYQQWKNDNWTGKESADSGKITLTPGATEKDLNFCWYSKEPGEPAVKIGRNKNLSDAKEYKGTATKINRSNWKNTYKASNKVSVLNAFQANTTYYYSYTDDLSGGTWSKAESYTTKDSNTYQIVLVGDPQIGASGSDGQGTSDDINIAVDTYNWKKTLTTVENKANNASFILSVGDQIDYSAVDSEDTKNVRESEYAGFLYPALLRKTPLATSIGNHESKGTDYKYHYNNPNSEDNLGATNSGSDYYFSYGNVLYIILNSNNRNVAEHSKLIQKAVDSHPSAKWKVVAFHHDIYGSGAPHSDTDGANLRTLFAPLMDQFNIDVCLTGHDHSYARTYQLIDGTAIDYGDAAAINPEGTLYVAAGSASGSKFYNLALNKQYYVAERSNNQLPTYSTIDFSEEKMTIRTYDCNGTKYADDFTIIKDKDTPSVWELLQQASSKKRNEYTPESFLRLQNAVSNMKKFMAFTGEDKGAVELSQKYDATLDSDQAEDPLNYYGYAQGDYADKKTQTTKLAEGFSTLLDKTTLQTLIKKILANTYQSRYQELAACLSSLEAVKPSQSPFLPPVATNNSEKPKPITTATKSQSKKSTLTLKKGTRKLTAKTVIKLKKGKSFKIRAAVKHSSKKIVYTSSNKKYVTVSKKGMVTAKKYTRKKIKITVTCGKLKKTFRVFVLKK